MIPKKKIILVGLMVLGVGVPFSFFGLQRILEYTDDRQLDAMTKDVPDGTEYKRQIKEKKALLKDRDPSNDAGAYTMLGVYYYNLGKKDEGIEFYYMALKLEPTNRLALQNIAGAYEDKQDWGRAEAFYQLLITSYPTYPSAYRSLATLYRYRFENAEARILELMRGGLEKTNDNPDLLSWMVAYYQEINQPEKATPYSKKIIERLKK